MRHLARIRPLVVLLALVGATAGSRAGDEPPARPRSPAGEEADGSLERLRSRLVETLSRKGAVRITDSSHDNTVNIVSSGPATRRAAAGAPSARPAAPRPWSYDGDTGPQAWSTLDPAFALCARGSRQSPIDIRDGVRVDLEPIAFDYRPSRAMVLDDGRAVRVRVDGQSRIAITGREFALQEFVFRMPGEERVDGATYPMSIQLVHRDAAGATAVVAVLVSADESAGAPRHAGIQSVWNALPLDRGLDAPMPAAFDPAGLLPTDRRYWTYIGSLTTPPCSEGVLWMVLKEPLVLPAAQIAVLARLYPNNARPVQAVAGRLIKESN